MTDLEYELLAALEDVLTVADAAAPATGMRSYGQEKRDRARTLIAKVKGESE